MSMWGSMSQSDIPPRRLRTPNEIYAEAISVMLDGNDPISKDDYALIINYIAANVLPDIAVNACELMRTLYDMPLTDTEVREIVEFQLREYN